MRKILKILFPFLLISSLLMVGVETTNAITSSSLGVKAGNQYEYTLGGNFGLNLPDYVWNEISSELSTPNLTIDAKQIYTDFNSLPHVFNMKASVGNFPLGPSANLYNTTIQMKLVNETNYMDLNPFLSNLTSICNNFTQKYNDLFNSITNGTNFFGNITDFFKDLLPTTHYNFSWDFVNNTNYNISGTFTASPMFYQSFRLFIPTNWNFITQENGAKDYFNRMGNSDFLHMFNGLPDTVNNFNALLTAMGVTTFDVQNKSILVKYNLANMNQDWLNFLMNYSKADMNYNGFISFNNILRTLTDPDWGLGDIGYLPNWLWYPLWEAINFDIFIQSLSSHLKMTITTPNMIATADLVYNNNGILQNAHSEFDLATSINGTSVDFNPQFDISSGIHNSIDANRNKSSTVTGYPIWLTSLASFCGMMVVVLTMIKKKRIKSNQI